MRKSWWGVICGFVTLVVSVYVWCAVPDSVTPSVTEVTESIWRCPESIEGAAYVAAEGSGVSVPVSCSTSVLTETRLCFAHEDAAVALDYPLWEHGECATPFSYEGETWIVDDLAVTVLGHEFSGCWISVYGTQICPRKGTTYLWVHLRRKHRAEKTQLPLYTCFWFRLVYNETWLTAGRYGNHYPGRQSWGEGGCRLLYANYSDEGWLGFEVPDDIDLSRAILEITSYKVPKLDRQWRLQ